MSWIYLEFTVLNFQLGFDGEENFPRNIQEANLR